MINWLLSFFKCKHEARFLHVRKDHTEVRKPEYCGLHSHATYHLYCMKCRADVPITYAKVNKKGRRRYEAYLLNQLKNENPTYTCKTKDEK